MFASKAATPQAAVADLVGKPARSGLAVRRSGAGAAGLTQGPGSMSVGGTEPGAAWDLSTIPVFSQGRAGTVQPPSPIAAPPLRAIQAKLVVGSSDDPLEHEADRTADRVMRMRSAPPPTATPSATGEALQRKCAACEEAEEPGKRHGAREAPGAEAPAIVADVMSSAGGPLDASARAFFEPRFGRDFSQVRVHSDDRAARSARSIGARAYTVGRHIAFAEGQYAPGSDHGRHLLAHELTHTIQQGAARVQRRPAAIRQADGDAADEFEGMTSAEPVTEEAAAPDKEVVRRSTSWAGATVHETISPAETIFGATPPHTWHMLNGTQLETDANADAAIAIPGITTQPLPSTDPAATWMAKVDSVPAQTGGGDETVLRPGPWTNVVTKVQAGAVTGLAACTGAGNSTFTRSGNPSDNAVYQANRRHEDHHLADHQAVFDDAIGRWDMRLQAALTAGTQFTGASAAAATAALWAAMGNTPQAAARDYRAQGLARGGAFHRTPQGGPMGRSNPVCNADCTTSGMDVTNPS